MKRQSTIEVTNVSKHGLWIFLGDEELFVPFSQFPCLKDAPISQLLNVKRPQPHHLYWPELDIDIAVESIRRPEDFPLVSTLTP